MTTLHTFWVQPDNHYPGQHAPQLEVAVDEYTHNENPAVFHDEVQQASRPAQTSPNSAHIDIIVDGDAIRTVLLDSADANDSFLSLTRPGEVVIACLFGQRRESYPGQYGPELLVAWDEFTIEGYEDGFEQDVDETKAAYEPDEFISYARVDISVPRQPLDQAFTPTVIDTTKVPA